MLCVVLGGASGVMVLELLLLLPRWVCLGVDVCVNVGVGVRVCGGNGR